MAINGITARRSFHQIWILGKFFLVKQAPGLVTLSDSNIINLSWVINFRLADVSVAILATAVVEAVVHAGSLYQALSACLEQVTP